MIANKIKTKYGEVEQYVRENWKEWFVMVYAIKLIEEGCMIPRFYLPVRRFEDKYAYECWIFPLAPFALAWIILVRAFWGIWKDLIHFSEYLKDKYKLTK